MKRREFLKGAAAVSTSVASSSATGVMDVSLMNDTQAQMSGSHFSPLRGLNKNGKFEAMMDANEADFSRLV